MPNLTASSFQSHLADQKSSEAARESVGTLEPVTSPRSLHGEWRRAIHIAKALARSPLRLWTLLMVYILMFSTIGLSANYTHVNYVHNGTLLFIVGGVAAGFAPTLAERPLLLAGLTSREIWRVVIMFACATTALTAISMGFCAILDIILGNVRVVDVYMIQHTGIGPYLWFLVPMGAFPGVIASACMSIANRYLTSGGTAAVVTPTILLMNPISYLIIPHALRTGLLGYIVYLLAAALVYPFLLRFILSRPRNEE